MRGHQAQSPPLSRRIFPTRTSAYKRYIPVAAIIVSTLIWLVLKGGHLDRAEIASGLALHRDIGSSAAAGQHDVSEPNGGFQALEGACTYDVIRRNQSIIRWVNASDPTDPRVNIGVKADGCRLEHTVVDDATRARKCLSRKHVVFIGDSLTRYQYLNFVSYLEKGNYSDHQPRSLVFYHDWFSMESFFELASRDELNSNEICDCARPWSEEEESDKNDESIENRFYWREEENIRVTFLSWLPKKEHEKVQGHHLVNLMQVKDLNGSHVDPQEVLRGKAGYTYRSCCCCLFTNVYILDTPRSLFQVLCYCCTSSTTITSLLYVTSELYEALLLSWPRRYSFPISRSALGSSQIGGSTIRSPTQCGRMRRSTHQATCHTENERM